MKEIVGFTNYTLSENGEVFSTYTGKVLQPVLDSTGYFIVTLVDGQVKRNKAIHRLLAEAFIPNPQNKEHVNHKDGNKTNNHLSNLEWNTPKENTHHAIRLGLVDLYNTSQQKSVEQVFEGVVVGVFKSMAEAQRVTGIPYPNISKVCKGVRRSAGGFGWRFSQTSETIL